MKKGTIPVRRCTEQFRSANFSAVADFRADVGERTITDIDIAALKVGHLFLGQAKVVIEPDSLYDRWKVLGKLHEAARQLDRTLEALPRFRDALLGRLGNEVKLEVIVPFIVTNSWQFTGITVPSYPVVDFSYLAFLLSGATPTAITARKEAIVIGNANSYIRGRQPTAEEMAQLIRRPIYEDSFPEGVRRLKLVKIGPYKIHLPFFEMEV